MARYIDVDELIRLIEIDALCNSGCFSKRDVMHCIKAINTADVAPKSEVEDLIYKLECLLCHSTGGKLSKHTYDLLVMEAVVTDYIQESYEEGYENGKSDAAMKIFAEIEFDIANLDFDREETRAIAIEGVIAELKKKYT